MSQTEQKPCIQKRIKIWILRIFFHPVLLFVFCSVIFFLVSFSIYIKYLEVLDYSKTNDIVKLIVETDGIILAFSGVIASIILKKFMEEPEKAKAQLANEYKKKRSRIISFIGTIVLILISSIFFGLGALITQGFVYNVLFSIILLFVGIVEVFAMLIYSIELEDF